MAHKEAPMSWDPFHWFVSDAKKTEEQREDLDADYLRKAIADSEASVIMDMVREFDQIVATLNLTEDVPGSVLRTVQRLKDGWRPIESAPRDGTHILIAFGEDVVAQGVYTRDDSDPHPWKFIDQQAKGVPIFNGARDDEYGPTHWQPLPHAPVADDDNRELYQGLPGHPNGVTDTNAGR